MTFTPLPSPDSASLQVITWAWKANGAAKAALAGTTETWWLGANPGTLFADAVRVAVFGSGAVGSYLGSRFAAARAETCQGTWKESPAPPSCWNATFPSTLGLL